MDEAALAAFGIAAGILNCIGLVPYLRDILRKKTKPERASWWVWLTLGLVALVAQFAAGARWSLGLTLASVLAMGAIAILSIPYGYGRFGRRDTISLLIAGIGVVVSILLRDPVIAIFVVIAVDSVGMWLTIQKTWQAPQSETLIAWVLAGTASVCGLLAVGDYNVARTAYPAYAVLSQGLLVAIIITRRTALSSAKRVDVS